MNFKKIKARFIALLVQNNTPHGIALGVAVGVCIGVTPLYGLHKVLFILAAMCIRRANKAAILLGTNISLPPTVPFITWGGYELGRLILPMPYPPLSEAYFSSIGHLSFWQIFKLVRHLYLPLFVGSMVMGVILAVLLYFITYGVAQRVMKNKPQ